MDFFECADGRVVSLADIMWDEEVLRAFHLYLKRSFMSESLDLYLQLDQVKTMILEKQDQKYINAAYTNLWAEFLQENCPRPVNLSFETIQYLCEEEIKIRNLQNDEISFLAIETALIEIWYLIGQSCLPEYIMSGNYQIFLEGKSDTSKTAFSRKKAEQFFGTRIDVISRFFFFFFFFDLFFFSLSLSLSSLSYPNNNKY
jgi:hypothetical protein